MRATGGVAFAALLACGAIAPAVGFTGAGSFASVASRQHASVRRSGRSAGSSPIMAIDPAAVHSLGEYVNAMGTAGLDQAWLSSVMHGEGGDNDLSNPVSFVLVEMARMCVVGCGIRFMRG